MESPCKAILGERDGTGGNSGGGDSGSVFIAGDVTELTECVVSKRGKRPIGTPSRYCAGCRRARGSGG